MPPALNLCRFLAEPFVLIENRNRPLATFHPTTGVDVGQPLESVETGFTGKFHPPVAVDFNLQHLAQNENLRFCELNCDVCHSTPQAVRNFSRRKRGLSFFRNTAMDSQSSSEALELLSTSASAR